MPALDTIPSPADEALLGRLFAHRAEVPASGQPTGLPACGGVVAFVTDNQRVVQLLATGSVRRAVERRLGRARDAQAQPNQMDDSGPRETEAGRRETDVGPRESNVAAEAGIREIRWQPAHSAFESDWLYLRLARQLLGRGYAKQLGFAPAWYAGIDIGEQFPRWTVQNKPFPAGNMSGPFATRKRCQQFVDDLEDLFDLCRYHDVLMQTPNGRRCAYFDMGKCPAPCDGTVSWEVYQAQLTASVSFAQREQPTELDAWRSEMESAANALEFERAEHCKQRLARATAMLHRDGRYALSPDGLHVLIVQRGAKRGWLRPFLYHAESLEACADITRDEVDNRVVEWLARLRASDKQISVCARYRAECAALVCHYLGKRKPASGIYLIVKPDSAPEEIARHIHQRYSRS